MTVDHYTFEMIFKLLRPPSFVSIKNGYKAKMTIKTLIGTLKKTRSRAEWKDNRL